jgi:two-component system OmpR family response regulator
VQPNLDAFGKILVVDDDNDDVELVTFVLRRAGFRVVAANDAGSALKLVERESPDAIVLDIELQELMDGFEFLKLLRRTLRPVPVLILTARGTEADRVYGLDIGADDYLAKPFAHRELVARVRALVRRAGLPVSAAPVTPQRLVVGPLTIDPLQHTANRDGKPLDLTVTEFRLLYYLMLNAGIVVSFQAIMRRVWGFENQSSIKMVRMALYRLRHKLDADPGEPPLIQAVPRVGVILKVDQSGAMMPALGNNGDGARAGHTRA